MIFSKNSLLNYINLLPGLPFRPTTVQQQLPHESGSLAAWVGLATWTVLDENGALWDVDWRYAFGAEIFKQHWIDFGLDEDKLLYRRKRKHTERHKLIVYICAPGMEILENYSGFAENNLNEESRQLKKALWHRIPERYVIGKYWLSIYRGLIPLVELPEELHGLLPATLPEGLNNSSGDYATNRILHPTPPEIVNEPQDEVQTLQALPPNPERQGEGGLRSKGLYKHPGTVDQPLISVITIVYNNVSLLEQTIQSVINQSSDRLEYIVIDGGSTDGTLEMIQKYDSQINYWVSEKDKGIYNAMNKGISLLQGDLHNFMNSGDFFIDLRAFEGNYQSYFFKTIYNKFNGENSLVKLKPIQYSIPYCHQGIIYTKTKHLFKLNYKSAADYLYTIENGCIQKFTSDRAKVYYSNDGVTSNCIMARLEKTKIVLLHFGVIYFIKSLLIELIKHFAINIYIMKQKLFTSFK